MLNIILFLICSIFSSNINLLAHKSPDVYMTTEAIPGLSDNPSLNIKVSISPSRERNLLVQAIQISYIQQVKDFKSAYLTSINKANTSAQQQIMQYMSIANLLPRIELQHACHGLTQELRELHGQLQKRITIRELLLQLASLPSTTKFLTQEQEQSLSPAWQYQYLHNEQTIHHIECAINIRKECFHYNKRIMAPIDAALDEAQARFIAQRPNTTPYIEVEQEIVKLHYSITGEEQLKNQCLTDLTKYGNQLDSTQKDIKTYDHWYKPWNKNKIAQLKVTADHLTNNINQTRQTIPQLQQTIDENKNELARLEPIATYGKRCVEDFKSMQVTFQQLDSKGIIDDEGKIEWAAINETLQSDGRQETITHELTPEGLNLLNLYGIDQTSFQKTVGNSFQKLLAQKLCSIVNRLGKAATEYRDEIVSTYEKATVQSCIVASEMIHYGTPKQALTWTRISEILEQATKVTRGIGRGLIRGTTETFENLINTALHPIQFVKQCKDMMNFIIHANDDGKLLERLASAYELFSQLPIDMQAEHATALLTSLLIPAPKLKTFDHLQKAVQHIARVMKIEAAALGALIKIEQASHVIVKGISVPEHWAPAIDRLVKTGKIIDSTDIPRWIQFFESPLSSGLTQAAKDIVQQAKNILPAEKIALAAVGIENNTISFASISQEVNAAAAVPQTIQRGINTAKESIKLKPIADTMGASIGKIDHLPMKCPTNKESYHHMFRAWVNKKRNKIAGGHMPRKYPELVTQVTGTNAQGIKQFTIQKGKISTAKKTAGPDHWNMVDYVKYQGEAYDNITSKETMREAVLRLEGVDTNGINWEIFLELKNGIYQLTTGYPLHE